MARPKAPDVVTPAPKPPVAEHTRTPAVQEHTRMIGLRVKGPKGFVVMYREVFPDGTVFEEPLTKMLQGPTKVLSGIQRALAFKLLHARVWKSWIR